MNSIYIKTKIYFGDKSLKHLSEIINSKIWIICDSFLVKNGGIRKILQEIDNSNTVNIFNEVVPDAPIEIIGKGVALFKKIKPDIIIAFGGGSAIDTAKGIIYFVKEEKELSDVKFIAIPTTSGTGSEVSSATVIKDEEENVKYCLFHEIIQPDEAILDADITLSIPPNITANTGFDVLTHALEAYVAKGANNYSDALAEKAVELTVKNLFNCYKDGSNKNYRSAMQEASTLAGIAFNIAGLGMCHSVAHQLGGMFHLPHGMANAIPLPEIIRINSLKSNEVFEKYAKMAYKTGMVEPESENKFAVAVLICYIKQLRKILNIPESLKEAGVSKELFEASKNSIVVHAMEDNCTPANPVYFSKEDLFSLFGNIY